MSEMGSYNEFLSAFGVSEGSTTESLGEPTKSVEEPVTPPEPETDPKTEPEGDAPADPQEPVIESKPDKAAQAFAQMRVENKQYQNMIKNVAEILGVKDTKNQEDMLASLNELVTKAQAQKQGVPQELLTRLQQLEQRDQEYTLQQNRQAAYLGFQKVKDDFKLSDADLNYFADSLAADGLNPFEQSIDLVAEYKLRNYDKLVAAAIEQGIRQEAERAAKAITQSSAPGQTQGKSSTDAEKITSVSELNNWFNNYQK